MSRRIDHKMWENPFYLLWCQSNIKLRSYAEVIARGMLAPGVTLRRWVD